MSDLWAHQQEAAAWAEDRRASMLAMEMGTGKTLVALELLRRWDARLVLVLCPKSVVQVWPREVAKHVVNAEEWVVCQLDKRTIAARTKHMLAEHKRATMLGKHFMAVINYEAAGRMPMGNALMTLPWDVLALDESHRIKKPAGQQSRFCSRLSDRVGRCIALTGTPMPHSPLDIYAQFRALGREGKAVFGSSYTCFKAAYAITKQGAQLKGEGAPWGTDKRKDEIQKTCAECRKLHPTYGDREGIGGVDTEIAAKRLVIPFQDLTRWLWLWRWEEEANKELRGQLAKWVWAGDTIAGIAERLELPEDAVGTLMEELGVKVFQAISGHQNLEELHEKLYAHTFRCRADEVLDLPPFTEQVRTCELGRKGRKAYNDMEATLIAELDEGTVTAGNALSRLLRLQQVTSGTVKTADDKLVVVDKAKADLLADLLTDIQPFDSTAEREPIVVFGRFLSDLDAIHEAAKKTGHSSAELSGRTNKLADWQRGDADVLAVQIQAGGLGIDLTRARYAIYYALNWSLGDHEQSKARVHRPGQIRPVTYFYLVVENSVDSTIIEALNKKKQVIDYVIDELRGGTDGHCTVA